jgi:ATP-dependent Clp protease ATP-binding subunit ClpA
MALPDTTTDVLQADGSIVGLDGAVDALLELLGRPEPATPCVVAASGAGRTTLLRALATRLADEENDGPLSGAGVVRLRPEGVVGGRRGEALRDLASQGERGSIVAVDDLEVVLMLASPAYDLDVRGAVRALVGRPELRTVMTLDATFRSQLEAQEAELYGELSFVELPELPAEDLAAIGERHAWDLSTRYALGVPPELVERAAAPRRQGDRRAHPGLMLDRLDHAATRARLRGSLHVTADDLEVGGASPIKRIDREGLVGELRRRIAGQDEAIGKVADRLALTTADLDLRPHRPNGVFLFAGPTGVGKTALAKALAESLYGEADSRLIRLDMSEYGEDWAVSRLFGPHPGYVGSDDPSGWLTTRVSEEPASLILLDEIEKAHPKVWNVFLQVFDDGRLTDTRGRTASFDSSVVVMTSNAGAGAFSANPLGFGTGSDREETAVSEVRTALTKLMPPEFINRVDETVVFRPLAKETIAEIALLEVNRTVEHLSGRGWDLSVEPRVVALIAEEGFDPDYGARHLQRNIERRLLQPLSELKPGAFRATLHGSEVAWNPASEGRET